MCKSLGDFIVAYARSLGKMVAMNNIIQNRGNLYYCDYLPIMLCFVYLSCRFVLCGLWGITEADNPKHNEVLSSFDAG
jgi:hypothetical protein